MQGNGDHASWTRATSDRMLRASSLASLMLTNLQKYEAAEAAGKKAMAEQAERAAGLVKLQAKNRIKKLNENIDSALQCMQKIETTVTNLNKMQSMLRHERYFEYAELQVCQKRLALRTKRPASEGFQDALQCNLEEEEAVLLDARDILLQREADMKQRRRASLALRADLSSDAARQRLQVEHENAHLKPSLLPSLKPTNKPKKQSFAKPLFSPTSRKAEAEAEYEATHIIVARSAQVMQEAEAQCAYSAGLVKNLHAKTGTVVQNVWASMELRTQELSTMKKQIESKISDLDWSIHKAEQDIERHTKRLDPQDKEKMMLISANRALLDSLLETKSELTGDLQSKIAALDIDSSCLRVTAQKAYETPQSKGSAPWPVPKPVPRVEENAANPQDDEEQAVSTPERKAHKALQQALDAGSAEKEPRVSSPESAEGRLADVARLIVPVDA